MKKPNFLDYSKIFEINNEFKLSTTQIGEATVVIVDNFYKRPDLVRDLILTIPPTEIQSVTGGTQGYRTQVSLDLSNLSKFWHWVATTNYEHARNWTFESVYNTFQWCNFNSNILTYEQQIKGRTHSWGVPHVDGDKGFVDDKKNTMDKNKGGLAGIVYLNTQEECAGGTSFYSFEGKQTVSQNDRPQKLKRTDKEPYNGWVTGSIGDWKLLETVEMKWNRFIMYPNWVLHHPHITENMNFDGNSTYRINQLLFP
jgi:hypothetical protein